MPPPRIVALLSHQRSAPVETRERLLGVLTPAPGRVALATCHRVELYAALSEDADPDALVRGLGVAPADRPSVQVVEGEAAAAHLFAVAAGLDSAVAGEPQILRQVRQAYLAAPQLDPVLARLFERALHVGRRVRRECGLTSERSVGSLAVDALLAQLEAPERSVVLVVGAGEMGKLAVRALARRVGSVLIANRDAARAREVAEANGAIPLELSEVPAALLRADAVVSAADTRGTVLDRDALRRRIAERGPLPLVDIAVPRSVAEDARRLPGLRYTSVDDLPGAAVAVMPAIIERASARCAHEARRFTREARVDRVDAIVAVRARAEVLRREKVDRAMRRLGHLSARDRHIIEALSTTLTGALLHAPLTALREDRADAEMIRTLFDGRPRP